MVCDHVVLIEAGVEFEEGAVLRARLDQELPAADAGIAQVSHKGGQLLPESEAGWTCVSRNPEARSVAAVRPDNQHLHHVEQFAVAGREVEVVARTLGEALDEEPVVAGGPDRDAAGKIAAVAAEDCLAVFQQARTWPQGFHDHVPATPTPAVATRRVVLSVIRREVPLDGHVAISPYGYPEGLLRDDRRASVCGPPRVASW